jgi:hypothetical protein
MTPSLLASVTAAALKKPIEELYSGAKGAAQRKLSKLRCEAGISSLRKSISALQKVKTMWNVEREAKLTSFYYPSKVIIDGGPKLIRTIAEIDGVRNFVIQGTVGQGKSIFLRFLCINECAQQRRIPIFVELRRFDPKSNFRNFLIEQITKHSSPCDDTLLEYLLESGKVVMLLDGFDEVVPEHVASLVGELETLAVRYAASQIVITSRPDSGIDKSPHFRVYKLAPLSHSDHAPFLERTVPDSAQRKSLLKAIERAGKQIQELLTTPLLMTLLVLVYNATQEIPTTLSAFYDELFKTLLSRHDATKAGYRRHRTSRLDDATLRRLFEAFSYAARQRNLVSLTEIQWAEVLAEARRLSGIQVEAEAFADDVCRVACLIQQEGFVYHFVHKSVAEFHAASFIRSVSENTAKRFYSRMMEGKFLAWPQELTFLEQIDRRRFLHYFLIPDLEALLRRLEIHPDTPFSPLSQERAISTLNSIVTVEPLRSEGEDSRDCGLSFSPHLQSLSEYRLSHRLISKFVRKEVVENFSDNLESNTIGLGDAAIVANVLSDMVISLNRGIEDVLRELKGAKEEIAREKAAEDLVAP